MSVIAYHQLAQSLGYFLEYPKTEKIAPKQLPFDACTDMYAKAETLLNKIISSINSSNISHEITRIALKGSQTAWHILGIVAGVGTSLLLTSAIGTGAYLLLGGLNPFMLISLAGIGAGYLVYQKLAAKEVFESKMCAVNEEISKNYRELAHWEAEKAHFQSLGTFVVHVNKTYHDTTTLARCQRYADYLEAQVK